MTRLYLRKLKSVGFVDVGACEGADIVLAKRRAEDIAKAVPTDAMAKNASRALEWRGEYNRGGTEVGVARARDIANKRDLSAETIGRMVNYFSRHEVDKQAEGFRNGEPGFPSAGRIAWDLWGGDEGATWAREQYDRIVAEKSAELEQLSKAGRKMAGPRLSRLREVVSQLSALLSEVDDESPDDDSGKDTSMKFDASTLPPEAQEYIAGIEKAAEERAAELAAKVDELTAQIAEPAPVEEDALKGVPAEIRKRLEDAEKAAAEAQIAAKAERDARVTAEFVTKCAYVEGKLPIKAEALGPILKRLHDAEQSAEDVAELERVLKAAAEASKVTAVIGEDGKPEGSAIDSIEKAAVEIRKNNPTLSLAAARVEARKLNPDLARAEKAERRAA